MAPKAGVEFSTNGVKRSGGRYSNGISHTKFLKK